MSCVILQSLSLVHGQKSPFTFNITEFHLDLLPLDQDLISLDIATAFTVHDKLNSISLHHIYFLSLYCCDSSRVINNCKTTSLVLSLSYRICTLTMTPHHCSKLLVLLVVFKLYTALSLVYMERGIMQL